MSENTLGTANNIHKATPDTPNKPYTCSFCDEDIKLVPGGQGPTWVHSDTGAVVGRHDPERIEARRLVESILQLSDHLAPIIKTHLDELNMDTHEDQLLVERLRLLVQPWYDKVLTLRALSHQHDEVER